MRVEVTLMGGFAVRIDGVAFRSNSGRAARRRPW